MIKKLMRSRGAGKFRRNKLAMGALGVIAVFFLMAAWMMLMDALQFVGKATGAYDLYETPIVSTFLPRRMLEEIGPPMLGGLGKPWGDDGRLNSVVYYHTRATTALETIDSVEGITDESIQRILEEAGVAERRLGVSNVEDLRGLVGDIDVILAEMDSLRFAANTLQDVIVSVDKVQGPLDALLDGQDSDDVSLLREEVAYSIDDITYAIEDYLSYSPESEAYSQELIDSIADASSVYYEPEGEAENLADVLGQVREATEAAVAEVAGGSLPYVIRGEEVVERLYPEPSGFDGFAFNFRQMLGTDRQGRSILIRSLYSAKIAIQVGVVVGFTAVLFGSILGAAAAFFGGWVDHVVAWLYSTFSSIPQLVLLAVLSFMFLSDALAGFRGLPSLYFAFAMTYWIGPCRVIRGEAMKIKELEYVQAATAIGFGRFYILMRHILPNTLHLMFINFSLLFIGAIKGEVILTFLGLGLPLGSGASWGIMISQAKAEVITGFFWQIGAATFFMFVLVLAFNIVSDALQDAFDPKHVN
ncbi:MAG: hypothetical protein Phyf2KO_02740 [Phycisphaerales bacterium]